jgi:hypothetical protein
MEREGGLAHERSRGRSHALGHAALAELPELEYLDRRRLGALVGVAPLKTGTPAPCAGYARCGAAGRG